MSRHPFTDPQPDDLIGWLAEDLMPTEPAHTKFVTDRDGDNLVYLDRLGMRTKLRRCTVATWRNWCRTNHPRCISTQHLAPAEPRCFCIGGPIGMHRQDCAAQAVAA